MPTAFQLVQNLEESPASGDDVWNDLALPVLAALMSAGAAGMTTSTANGVAKDAGLPYHMAPDAIAWLHIQGMAAWRGRRWYDAAVAPAESEASDASDAPEERGTWKKRGKKPKAVPPPARRAKILRPTEQVYLAEVERYEASVTPPLAMEATPPSPESLELDHG
jgi:hypothetical protein